MADSVAARKQAEGAQRHAEGLLNNDSKVRNTRIFEWRKCHCLVLETRSKGNYNIGWFKSFDRSKGT